MRRPFILGVAGALLLAVALALQLVLVQPDPGAPATPDAPPSAAVATPSAAARAVVDAAKQGDAARAAPTAPSFDIVRVNPRGDAVIAGRAEPGAEVEVRDGARVIGRATADERGEWVVLPSEPLPGGQRALSVQAARPGAPPLTSEVVVLDLPATAAGTSVASAAAPGASAPRTAVTEQAVVEPGNSLWELARRRYGQGTAYGAIYQANRGLIRDPDLIYPGQVFVMPPGP